MIGEEGRKEGRMGERMGELTTFSRLLCPLVRFALVFLENRLRANHIPRTERHHGQRVSALRGTGVEMYAQRWILGTMQRAVLVGVAETVIRLRVAEIRGLRVQLGGVGFVLEDIITVAALVEETKLVRRSVVLEVRRLGGTLEPLQTLPLAIDKA